MLEDKSLIEGSTQCGRVALALTRRHNHNGRCPALALAARAGPELVEVARTMLFVP